MMSVYELIKNPIYNKKILIEGCIVIIEQKLYLIDSSTINDFPNLEKIRINNNIKSILLKSVALYSGVTALFHDVRIIGYVVNLDSVVKQFDNIRPTGVNVYEINDVLIKNGISSEATITLDINQLKNLSIQPNPTIVGVKAGEGGHFIIVDFYKQVDGAGYYMIRDPYNGAMGIKANILETRLNHNGVILK